MAVFRNGRRVLRHLCRTNNYDGYFSTEKFFNSLDNSADPTGNRSAASAYLHRNQGFKSLQLRENRRWHLWLNTSIFGVSKPWKQLCRRRFHLRHLYCWTLLEATPGFEPGNQGFADPCLTTWLCRRIENRSKTYLLLFSFVHGAGDGARTVDLQRDRLAF